MQFYYNVDGGSEPRTTAKHINNNQTPRFQRVVRPSRLVYPQQFPHHAHMNKHERGQFRMQISHVCT